LIFEALKSNFEALKSIFEVELVFFSVFRLGLAGNDDPPSLVSLPVGYASPVVWMLPE
jgi:hypothetical protein